MGVTVDTKVNSAQKVKHHIQMNFVRLCILISAGVATKVSAVLSWVISENFMLFIYHCIVVECDVNYFGINCKEMCNVTCNGCNRTTGICDTGCKPGWRDIYCHKGI